MNVDVIEVPGHTDGSVVFSIQDRDILFTGDAIGSGQGVWIFHETGFRQYAASVPRLVEWIENPSNGVSEEGLSEFTADITGRESDFLKCRMGRSLECSICVT